MTTKHSLRGDIQGLRAVAVMIVLLFHVWPSFLPGGYVGVDVFFVISGYLIVGTLARTAERDGKISLREFYARRIRRLLPAGSLVLVASLIGTFIFLPQPQWQDTFLQVLASATYAENWYLVWSSVDYLAADNAASPVQHYWSLSIEEQFYIVWPLIVVGLALAARLMGLAARHLMGAALAAIFALSLIASIVLAQTHTEQAYFFTHTRAWELALGGLLAIWLPRINAGERGRGVLSVAGLLAILGSAIFYRQETPFPGFAALLPTLGAAAVIVAGDVKLSAFRGLDYAPLRYIGDISYSLYLWHWPLIVFYLASGVTEVGLVDGLALVLVSILLAHLSYRYVEERFRYPASNLEWRPIVAGLASVVCLALTSGAAYAVLATRPIPTLAQSDANYPGPAALVDGAPTPPDTPLIPAAVDLKRDKSPVYDSGCHQDDDSSDVSTCIYGDPEGSISVAVVGSSHSVNWLPTIDVLGKRNGWRVVSVTKSGCGFRSTSDDICLEWIENVFDYFRENPVQTVFIAEFSRKAITEGEEQLIANRWRNFTEAGISVLAIRPTPQLDRAPERCLPDKLEECTLDRSISIRPNTAQLAATSLPNVYMVDMNNAICPVVDCGPVVGNIAVFRDTSHLTMTYAVALAPYLESEIRRLYPDLLPFAPDGAQHAPVSTAAAVMCRPSRTDSSTDFSRTYDANLEDGVIEMRSGDWENQQDDFELWSGKVDGSSVSIIGSYRQGSGGIKDLAFDGELRGNAIIAQGSRGPRECSLFWPV